MNPIPGLTKAETTGREALAATTREGKDDLDPSWRRVGKCKSHGIAWKTTNKTIYEYTTVMVFGWYGFSLYVCCN